MSGISKHLPHRYWLIRIALQRKLYEATECGHKTHRIGVWKAFGEERIVASPIEDGKTSYCHECLEKMAIQCTWCGKAIFLGQSITLSFATDPEYEYPDYAVGIGESDKKSYVGCLRWNCADSGLSYAGYWDVPGKVTRMPSPLELALNVSHHSQDVVVFNDLSDPKQVLKDASRFFNSS